MPAKAHLLTLAICKSKRIGERESVMASEKQVTRVEPRGVCKVMMLGGGHCNRESYTDEHGTVYDKCICHVSKPRSAHGLRLFNHELANKTYIRDGRADFRAFVFPASGWVLFGEVVDYEVVFNLTKFEGNIDLRLKTFTEPLTFVGCEIEGKADFSHSKFESDLIFADVTHPRHKHVSMDFRSCEFLSPEGTRFENIDLSGALFKGTSLRQVTFSSVIWAGRGVSRLYARNRVYDEVQYSWREATTSQPLSLIFNKNYWEFLYHPSYLLTEDTKDAEQVAQVCRDLQESYQHNYRYAEAADFYIGEQEVLRKSLGPIARFFSVGFLYKWISNYGQSTYRPLLWMTLLLLMAPLIMLGSGISVNDGQSHDPIQPYIQYTFDTDCDHFLLTNSDFQRDYFRVFAANFGYISFAQSTIQNHIQRPEARLFAYCERIGVVVLVSFFLLALRRQFKRRSF